jgi:hypothetical protein
MLGCGWDKVASMKDHDAPFFKNRHLVLNSQKGLMLSLNK